MNGNATRHVVTAMALTFLLFLIAGDQWNARISRFGPVTAAPKAT